MRVLWFTNTPSLYAQGMHHYHGGGWISSLEQLIRERTDITLGISFFHANPGGDQPGERVSYYPLAKKKRKGLSKLFYNWSCRIDSEEYLPDLLRVINDFKPDIIQIFGTENAFSLIQGHTNVPVVIHMQGIIAPYNNAFYPAGMSWHNIFFESSFFRKHLLGNSLLFDKKRFAKQAEREVTYFSKAKYLMGRTAWDHSVSGLIAPQAKYFHVDEVLRPVFYETQTWQPAERKTFVIVSTLSTTIYKGLDLVMRSARLLKQFRSFTFEWRVAGLRQDDPVVKFFEHQLGFTCNDCGVSIVGAKDSDALITFLKDSDLFVHASYIENSPNSVCEAQIMGVPVVATQVGGIPTIVEHGTGGFLVPSNSPHEMAAAIASLLNDPARAKELSAGGIRAATKRHDRGAILSDLTNAYHQILEDQQ